MSINLETARDAVRDMDSYRQSLREGESCAQRRVPVMDIGQRFVEHVLPAVRRAREAEVARRRQEKADRMRNEQRRRITMLVEEAVKGLEELVMQEIKETEILLPESKEPINVDQVFTVIQNGT